MGRKWEKKVSRAGEEGPADMHDRQQQTTSFVHLNHNDEMNQQLSLLIDPT